MKGPTKEDVEAAEELAQALYPIRMITDSEGDRVDKNQGKRKAFSIGHQRGRQSLREEIAKRDALLERAMKHTYGHSDDPRVRGVLNNVETNDG